MITCPLHATELQNTDMSKWLEITSDLVVFCISNEQEDAASSPKTEDRPKGLSGK